MSKKLIAGVLVLLIVVFGVKVLLTLNGPSDSKLVQEALASAVKASKEGRPGGVMDYLSDSLKLNEQSPARTQIADFIRRAHPDIEVQHPEPVVSQEQGTAQINSPVRLQISFPGSSGIDTTIPNVTMKFQREDAREWLFIPTKKWRLVSVTVPEIPPDLMMKLSGFSGF